MSQALKHGKDRAIEKGEKAWLDEVTEVAEEFLGEIQDWLDEVQSNGLTNLGLDSWQRDKSLKLLKKVKNDFYMNVERAG